MTPSVVNASEGCPRTSTSIDLVITIRVGTVGVDWASSGKVT